MEHDKPWECAHRDERSCSSLRFYEINPLGDYEVFDSLNGPLLALAAEAIRWD